MNKQKVRWKEVEKYFRKRGYFIYDQGQDKFIATPTKIGTKRNVVRIPHECCFTASAEVTRPFLGQIQIVFGVTPEQIKKG